MSTTYYDQLFESWKEFDSGRTHSDIKFQKCEFVDCTLGLDQENMKYRPRVNNTVLERCRVSGGRLRGVIVEETLVDGLKTSGLFQTWATVFKHVTLKGKIDRLMLSDLFHPGFPTSQFQKIVAQANADYYATVDWALDIREAEFIDFDCRGVPAQLVRRDPETQIMVTRERLLACGDAISAGGELWKSWLQMILLDEQYPNVVLPAPKRHRQFKELVAGLHELRRAGVAEPD